MRHGTLWRADEPLCARAALAACARERMRGLLGRTRMAADEALWIAPCNAVHTFGMRMAIDVVLLAGDGTVLAVHGSVAPGRLRMHWRARAVVELAAGRAAALALRAGQRLRFQPRDDDEVAA